jgi:hypothetical protein
MGIRLCLKHRHFNAVCIFGKAERMWKMTFTFSDLQLRLGG